MYSFFEELKRRNIFRVLGVYAVVGWLIIQLGIALETSLNLPSWFDTLLTTLVLIGFPVAMTLAWAFEMTPEGVKRTNSVPESESITHKTGQVLDIAILAGLTLVAALIIGARFIPQPETLSSADATDVRADEQSIAVLPFEDFSADKDQEYFASGISEELLNVLARIEGLRVSSRTSAFAFKGQETPISEIGEALNVAHVLEGSVRKSGSTLRITAQLIDTGNDVHLWSETYDRPLTADNIFAIQDEIAEAIVGELRGRLKFNPAQTSETRTDSLEGYELYLRARETLRSRHPDDLLKAEAGFKEVIKLDPDFAPAYAGLTDVYLLMVSYSSLSQTKSIELATPYFEKALDLAPNSPEVLISAALFAGINLDYPKAEDYAKRAIAISPNNSDAYIRLGNSWLNRGDCEKALEAYEAGLKVDPLSSVLLANAFSCNLELGKLEKAKLTAEKNIRWNSENPNAHVALGALLRDTMDIAGAHHAYKNAEALNPDNTTIQTTLSALYHQAGLSNEAINGMRFSPLKALALAYAGQSDAARELVREEPLSMEKLYTYYFNRELDTYFEYVKQLCTSFACSEDNLTSSNIDVTGNVAYIHHFYNSPEAEKYIGLMDTYYVGKTPADFEKLKDLENGARYEIVKDRPENAYLWINHIIEVGQLTSLLAEPLFDPTRDTQLHKATEDRLDAARAPYQAAILEQLANPEPHWVTP